MREYCFELEVTHLVQETQKRQLMLYPLLIYVLGQGAQMESVAWQSAVTPERTVILWEKLDNNFAAFFKTYVKKSLSHIENGCSYSESTPPSGTLYILSRSPKSEDGRKVVYLHDFRQQKQKAFLHVTVQADYTNAEMTELRQLWQQLCHTYSDFNGI